MSGGYLSGLGGPSSLYNFPEGTAEQAPMHGTVGEPGQYFVLIHGTRVT